MNDPIPFPATTARDALDVLATVGRITVLQDRNQTPGLTIWVPDERTLIVHPLDAIALQHPRDPYARLDAAMDWILRRTMERLDALERRILDDTAPECAPWSSAHCDECPATQPCRRASFPHIPIIPIANPTAAITHLDVS